MLTYQRTPKMLGKIQPSSWSLSLLILVALQVYVHPVQAQVISPTGQEVQFSYSATMTADTGKGLSPKELAQFHANHMFGIFHSPSMIRYFILDPSFIGGIGAPQTDLNIKIISQKKISASKVQMSYQAAGKMILHQKVAQRLIRQGSISIPMPVDPYEIYDAKCTDDHYTSFGDFWYFYDPFRPGCEHLKTAPLANQVLIKINLVNQRKLELTPRLDLLRGNNDNGDLFSVSVIHGYSDSANAKDDDGKLNYELFNSYLAKNGFSETSLYERTSRPMKIFTKSLKMASGKTIQIEIKHLLVETSIGSKTVSFAKFFKEAVQSADVIVYSGHSGLGGNLDIPSLEAKSGPFLFNAKKRQIFFFDSCSSYSYYLPTFSAQKTKVRIDVITNGLSSYFAFGVPVLEKFMNILFDPKIVDMPWIQILNSMEEPLDGGSYLINVGGV